MLTAQALTGFKEHVKRSVAYARYKVGTAYYKADITDIYIDSAGRVAIEFVIDHSIPGNITVTEVQLFDTAGQMWLSKGENISRKASQEGIFYRFTIDITEV